MHAKNNKYIKANENIPPLHVSKKNKTNDRNKITKTNKESWKSKRIFFREKSDANLAIKTISTERKQK